MKLIALDKVDRIVMLQKVYRDQTETLLQLAPDHTKFRSQTRKRPRTMALAPRKELFRESELKMLTRRSSTTLWLRPLRHDRLTTGLVVTKGKCMTTAMQSLCPPLATTEQSLQLSKRESHASTWELNFMTLKSSKFQVQAPLIPMLPSHRRLEPTSQWVSS